MRGFGFGREESNHILDQSLHSGVEIFEIELFGHGVGVGTLMCLEVELKKSC